MPDDGIIWKKEEKNCPLLRYSCLVFSQLALIYIYTCIAVYPEGRMFLPFSQDLAGIIRRSVSL